MPAPTDPPIRPRVVCGIRATGRMHLGNFLGAVRTFAELSRRDDLECYFFVADLHTLTTLRDPAALRALLPEVVLDYLAAGVDPDRATVFTQSSVPETSELAWLLASITHVSELERLPNFREWERRRAEGEPLNAGLLNYPLLMAADILGPRAHQVTVGEDQYPHIELVRDIARRFNRRFMAGAAPFFPEPEPATTEPVRVPGLDGSGKMGKSEGNTLLIDEPSAARWDKLVPAATDRQRPEDHGTPERCGIYAMHQLVSTPAQIADVAAHCRAATVSCLDCKGVLHRNIDTLLEPIRLRRRALADRKDLVAEVLAAGRARARPIIAETRDVVQDKIGIVRY